MYKEIDSETLKKWINTKKEVQLIDVRMPFEYKSQHIEGSILIPLGEINERITEIDKKRPIVFICRSGARSGAACEFASKKGYDVYNLIGGVMGFF